MLLAWLGGATAPMPADDAIALGLDQPAAVYQSEEQSRDPTAVAIATPPPAPAREERS